MQTTPTDDYTYGATPPPAQPAPRPVTPVIPIARPRRRSRFLPRLVAFVAIMGGLVALFTYPPVSAYVENVTGESPAARFGAVVGAARALYQRVPVPRFVEKSVERDNVAETNVEVDDTAALPPSAVDLADGANEYEYMYYGERLVADMGEGRGEGIEAGIDAGMVESGGAGAVGERIDEAILSRLYDKINNDPYIINNSARK